MKDFTLIRKYTVIKDVTTPIIIKKTPAAGEVENTKHGIKILPFLIEISNP